MNPITIDSTFDLGNIITLLSSIFGLILTIGWMKLLVARHETALFYPTGEARLVSFEAHDRMTDTCRKSLMIDSNHQGESVNRLITTIDELSKRISLQGDKIDKLRQCVTLLSMGGKPEDC